MLALVRFFYRTHLIWLYLLYMSIALFMIGNNRQITGFKMHRFWMNTTAGIRQKLNGINQYIHLRKENQKLLQENQRLYNIIYRSEPLDNNIPGGYRFAEAHTVYVGNARSDRFIIIDKGSEDGVKIQAGVINPNGVVGIVSETSSHFSKVLLTNNPQISIDVKLRHKKGYGFTQADHIFHRVLRVVDWPENLKLSEDDTLVTGGLSLIFPPNIPVGRVKTIRYRNNRTEIILQPFVNLNDPGFVYILTHPLKEEMQSLIHEN